MSNPLAVAAVTATLRNLLTKRLSSDLGGGSVTTKPLDKARDPNNAKNQLNLFLYQVTHDAAWLNMNMPNQLKAGETGYPPLPLVLHYLITAYGENDDAQDPVSHTLLGKAMSVLHDHSLLGADEIKSALKGNDLGEQIERVRITPQPLSLEEMSKLWTAFQTQYRISAAYQVSVVLIESSRSSKAPLPVLTRGKDDSGVKSQGDLTPPFPTLTEVVPPKGQPSAQLGDTIKLKGFHLDGNTVKAQFKHPHLVNPLPLVTTLARGTATEASVKIPDNAPQDWLSGIYTVSLLIQRTGESDRMTNELPLAIAPKITSTLPLSVTPDIQGTATIDVKCSPEVLPEQRAYLLLSDANAQQIPAQARQTRTDKLIFIVPNAPINKTDGFFIRLRVGGVDSLLIKDYEAEPPVFDQTQKVKIG